MAERVMRRFLMADIRDNLEGPIERVIEALQNVKAKADAGGYSKVEIDLDARISYDDPFVEAEVYGFRLETEAEAEEREARAERSRLQQLDYARRQYEALKAQFGDA